MELPESENNMYQAIKFYIRQARTARVMRRLDREFFRLEVIALNSAKSIMATERVLEAIDDGTMR